MSSCCRRISSACKLKPLPLNLADFGAALALNAEWSAVTKTVVDTLNQSGVPVLDVAYEQLLGDRDKALAAVLDFLRVPAASRPQKTEDVYAKATSDDLRASLPNFDEVEAWLSQNAPCLLPMLRATDPGMVFGDECGEGPTVSRPR